jgi:hypothetical protein
MDIEPIDFFRSKYVMDQPDVTQLIPDDVIARVRGLRCIQNIADADEQKHQEALKIYPMLSSRIRNTIIEMYCDWMGIPNINPEVLVAKNTIMPFAPQRNNPDVDDMKEEKEENDEKKEKKKKKKYITALPYTGRKRVLPIGFHNEYDTEWMTLKDVPDTKICITILKKKICSLISLNYCDLKLYDIKNTKHAHAIASMFQGVRYYNREAFKTLFEDVVTVMQNYLSISGIYDEFPTLTHKDEMEIAAHVICIRMPIATNIPHMDKIRHIIEYDSYTCVWGCFRNVF